MVRRPLILFVLFLTLLLTSSAARAQAQLSIPDLNSEASNSVLIPVSISGGDQISALQFKLVFDSSILTPASENGVLRGDRLTDHTVGTYLDDDELRVVVFSGSLSSLEPGGGSLLSLLFTVSPQAPPGASSTLTLVDLQGSDGEGASVDIATDDGSLTVSSAGNQPSEGENEIIFPQFANGNFGSGDFGVSLLFVNRSEALAYGRLRLIRSDGTPFVVSLTDDRSGSEFDFQVPRGAMVFFQTDAQGPLATGYARVTSTAPLGGVLVFTQRDAQQKIVTEAGVGSSPPGPRFSIPILFEKGKSRTGIAFVNLQSEEATVDLTLKDVAGQVLDTLTLSLAGGRHSPQFASELFSSLTDTNSFKGSIEIESSIAISVIALKQQGALLTTFPAVSRE